MMACHICHICGDLEGQKGGDALKSSFGVAMQVTRGGGILMGKEGIPTM